MSANHDIIAKKPRLKKKNPLSEKIFTVVLLVALFCMFILPFYYMIISSFKSLYEAINPKPVWWPETFIWENYAKAWKMANFPKYTLNTLILSVSCSVACIVVSVPAAFAPKRKSVPQTYSLGANCVSNTCKNARGDKSWISSNGNSKTKSTPAVLKISSRSAKVNKPFSFPPTMVIIPTEHPLFFARDKSLRCPACKPSKPPKATTEALNSKSFIF